MRAGRRPLKERLNPNSAAGGRCRREDHAIQPAPAGKDVLPATFLGPAVDQVDQVVAVEALRLGAAGGADARHPDPHAAGNGRNPILRLRLRLHLGPRARGDRHDFTRLAATRTGFERFALEGFLLKPAGGGIDVMLRFALGAPGFRRFLANRMSFRMRGWELRLPGIIS